MINQSFSRGAAIALATSTMFGSACNRQVDNTTVDVKSVAMRPNLVNETTEIAPGVFHVPANEWPSWLVKFRNEHPNVAITAISQAGQVQTASDANNNVSLTSGMIVVTNMNQR